jgi:hypothetical protein
MITQEDKMPSGTLPAKKWVKVVEGWGFYSVRYGASTSDKVGEYRTYTSPIPWPVSSGKLPDEITHQVRGYGSIWLYSPVDTTYYLNPVGPDQ